METEGLLLSCLDGACFYPSHLDACGGEDIDVYSCCDGVCGAADGGISENNLGQNEILQQDFWASGVLFPVTTYQPTMELVDPSTDYTAFTTGSLPQMFSSELESTATSVTHSCSEFSSAGETTPQLMSSECSGDYSTDSILRELFPELVESRLPSLCLDDDGSSNGSDGLVLPPAALLENCANVWDASMELGNWGNIQVPVVVPGFTDSQGVEDAFGIRRTYSDGDITDFGNGDTKVDNMPIVPQHVTLAAMSDTKMEDRRAKILRYRKKKTERNFGRKIKYACRKALADSQPRVRGRFAKTEDWRGSTGTI